MNTPKLCDYTIENNHLFTKISGLNHAQFKWLSTLLTYKKKTGMGGRKTEKSYLFRIKDGSFYTLYGIAKTLFDTGILKTFPSPHIGDEKYTIVPFPHGKVLRDYQLDAVTLAKNHKKGALEIATGSGKTLIMSALVRELTESGKTVTIVVPSIYIAYQIKRELIEAGVDREFICSFGGGSKEQLNSFHRVLLSVVNSLSNEIFNHYFYELGSVNDISLFQMDFPSYMLGNNHILDFLRTSSALLYDECHHSAASTYFMISSFSRPEYLLGFSGSLFENNQLFKDIDDTVLLGIFGKPVMSLTQKELVDRGVLSKPVAYILNNGTSKPAESPKNYSKVETDFIVNDEKRNTLIINSVNSLLKKGIQVLVLVNRKEHAEKLLIKFEGKAIALFGGETSLKYEKGRVVEYPLDFELFKQEFSDKKHNLIIATQVLDEGIDLPSIGALVLAGAGKGRRKLIQRIGRALRKKPDLKYTIILDFYDRTHIYLYHQFFKRKKIYDELGIECHFKDELNDSEIDLR